MAAINKLHLPTIDSFDGDYFFLSNFYPSPIIGVDDGIEYPTVEHYFQAHKVMDFDERRKIAAARTPGMAKRAGRAVDLRPDWERVKVGIMNEALTEKFKDPELLQKLLDTGDKRLVEGNNWHDNYWGDCHCPKCMYKTSYNKLGGLLTQIRHRNGGKL